MGYKIMEDRQKGDKRDSLRKVPRTMLSCEMSLCRFSVFPLVKVDVMLQLCPFIYYFEGL